MSKLDSILGKPRMIENVGLIYPVKIRDWEAFEEYGSIFQFKKEHFTKEQNDDTLLETIFKQGDSMLLLILVKALSIVLKIDEGLISPFANDGNVGFVLGGANTDYCIDQHNFDEVKQVILEQNLLIEPRVFKNKMFEEVANKWLEMQTKDGISLTLEDKLSTVAVWYGKRPSDFLDYTYYEFEAIFQRICQFQSFSSQSIMFANPYMDASNMKLIHFAESINLRKDPYEGFDKGIDLKTLKESVN
ncbi:hypothetical protein [Priestia flexa]|uniref:hypothetical protein n=1 Tax=Priestia flexa TaxID=86664 RepID=UPI000473D77A|nr:hypothetical protein [Priestia flexa]